MFLVCQTLTIAVFTVLVGACSSTDTVSFNQVKESAVHRILEAKFNAETGVLRILAEGRVGGNSGTTVRYPEPSYIKVNGEPMELCDGEKSHSGCNPLDEHLQSSPADSPEEAAAKVIANGFADAIRNLGRGTYYFYERKIAKPALKYTITWRKEDGSEDLLILPLASPVDFAEGEAIAWQGPANVDRKTDTEKVALLVSGPNEELNPSLRQFSEISQTPGAPLALERMLSLPEQTTQSLQFIRLRRGEIHDDYGNRQATFTAEYSGPKRHQAVGAAKTVTSGD